WVQEMIHSILIEVLGSIAEAERLKIRIRQREGIDAAKRRNVRFGRPPAPLPDNWEKVVQAVKRGEMRPVDAMRVLGVSRSSFYRLCSHYK
ncbi:MAG: recombinase family protein, partial [Clostridia bacterium]|nr:recombinase family protein [Clostridia bacterium]